MEGDLFCNVKKCRKRISSGMAWATSCSHIFCYEDGQNILASDKRCPACSSVLTGKFDIIRIDTNPDEVYRSMVLLGQRPDVALDICNRSISAWLYQSQQEYMYKNYLMNRAEEKYNKLKRYLDQFTSSMQLENKALKSQLSNAKLEIDSVKKLNEELSTKLREKTRQYQKLQMMYNKNKRASLQMNEGNFGAAGDADAAARNEAFLSAFDAPFGASTNPSRTVSPLEKVHRQSTTTTPRSHDFRFSHPSTPFENHQRGAQDTSFRQFFNWSKTSK